MAKNLNEAAKALGSKGGKQRAKNLTPEQRREIGRKGAQARWAKKGTK
jgi:general stress protein YciG